jgi:hypothetical protein
MQRLAHEGVTPISEADPDQTRRDCRHQCTRCYT